MRLSIRVLCIAVSLSAACGEDATPPDLATLSLTLATPSFTACYDVEFPGEARHALCGPGGEVSAPCDPALGPVRVGLRLATATGGDGAELDAPDPCGEAGCAVDVACGAEPTVVNLMHAHDDTRADWTQTHVALPVGWGGGLFVTCRDRDQPLRMSLGSESGPSRKTALLGLAGASEVANPMAILASEPVIACDGAVRCALPIADPSAGESPDAPRTATCSDGGSVGYAVRRGAGPHRWSEAWEERYLTVLIDLDDLIEGGLTGCRVDFIATLGAPGLEVGPREAYPVIATHGPLLDADGALICHELSTDDYTHEDPSILGVRFLRGAALLSLGEPWEANPPLCAIFDGVALHSSCN